MQYNDILKKLETLSNPEAVEGMAKYGIIPEKTYGVSIPELRKIAKKQERTVLSLNSSGHQIPVKPRYSPA